MAEPRRCLGVAVLILLFVLALPAGAAAEHNNDEHSGMTLVASMPKPGDLSPFGDQLQTANSDIAFWGRRAYFGHYNGFRIMDISNPRDPRVLSDFECRGAQDDVSVWQNRLLILSIDEPQLDSTDPHAPNGACTTAALAEERETATNFEGIRIFDVSDPRNPRLIKGVDTDCGSHTHTLVPDPRNSRLLVYVSSYPLRAGPVCGPNTSGRDGELNSLHAQIAVVEIPLHNPAAARVIAEPKLANPVYNLSQIDPEATGFFDSVACHDITVFLELELAAAACLSNGQLWDISDLAHPKTLPQQGAQYVDRPEVEFWHSSGFTWDGRYVLFGDERIREGGCESVNAQGGRLYIYRNRQHFAGTQPVSSFMIPRDQHGEYCSSHLWNQQPRTDARYVIAESWYNGGADVIDFTDVARPQEVAFYDVAHPPGDEGNWSAYWYRGNIYATDIERGNDVFALHGRLNHNTIDFGHENPQTQERLIRVHSARAARKSRRSRRSRKSRRARARALARHRRLLRSFKPLRGPSHQGVVRALTP
jgi:hypothetical protein